MLVADSHFEPIAPRALPRPPRGPDLDGLARHFRRTALLVGRNPKLAWAAVNAGVVVTDLYTETLRRDGHESTTQALAAMKRRVELLRVRGRADVTLAVRSTSHGPLLPSTGTRRGDLVSWSGARSDGRADRIAARGRARR